ncbi:MAG: hypothetical protein GFH27_549283n62 [Chloroflexi bacterium AL-W]|nr:hypothetical protein [Chloroflexi bacterium AL-N10]NOK76587.1 hypothetical protein [Chloroflexi bacterium AL-N5]NOK80183.1 hypothetical protein [Chloroflexi bacterium AL-W]NOK86696.1 hypothetical protein [Chloroflexi bacterium AL-N15]
MSEKSRFYRWFIGLLISSSLILAGCAPSEPAEEPAPAENAPTEQEDYPAPEAQPQEDEDYPAP